MYKFRRIFVTLKLDNRDVDTLRYAAMISRHAEAERVYFAHVAEPDEIPLSIREEYPQTIQGLDETVQEKMEAYVNEHFLSDDGPEVFYDVARGSVVLELLELIRHHDIDLVISGRAARKKESGGVPERLARKAPCSVLIVPHGSTSDLKSMLVPVDFHNEINLAFEEALEISRHIEQSRIVCLYVYRVPMGYYKAGKTYEEFAEIMRGHAQRAYEQFLEKFDTSGVTIRPHFELAKGSTADAIDQVLKKQASDLVVIGARGRRKGAGLLLASTTERMIWRTGVPLMAVKKKGEGMSFLDALLKL